MLSCSLHLCLLALLCCGGALAAAHQTRPGDAAHEHAAVVVEANVTRPVIIQSLFNASVDTVMFAAPSFTLVPAAWAYVTPETPYVLTRNFTIVSQLTPPTVIDYSFLEGKVVMNASTSFTFDNVALLNTRWLNTLYFSFFVNSPGAVVHIRNSILVDPVCNASSPAEDLAAVQALPQLPGQPRNVITAAPVPLCLEVQQQMQCFDSGVLLHALTVIVASDDRRAQAVAHTKAEAAAALEAGGFVIQYTNTTRVCRHYLSQSCLEQHPDNRTLCWEQAAAAGKLMGGGFGNSGDSKKTAAVVGAVVGGVVGAILVCCAALLLWRHRRRSKARSSGLSSSSTGLAKSQAGATGAEVLPSEGGSGDASHGHDRSQRYQPSLDLSSGRRLFLEDGSVRQGYRQGSLQQQQEYLVGMGGPHDQQRPPRPSFGREGVHLGVLLGAGSYGRVYKGKWHGREVAIKIIHCPPSELHRVLCEAEIMMHLDHPNIVRALNCILQHTPKGKAAVAAAAEGQQGSSGQATEQAGDSGGRRSSTSASSVSQMLPVLRRSMQQQHGSGGSTSSAHGLQQYGHGDTSLNSSHDNSVAQAQHSVAAGTTGAALGPAAVVAAGASAGFEASCRQQPKLPGPVAAHQQQHEHHELKQVHDQEPYVQQQEVQVLPVLVTGSGGTGSTPGSQPQQQQQLQQQQQQRQQQRQLVPSWERDSGGAVDTGEEDEYDAQEQVAEVWLVLELCTGGNLQDAFRHHKDGFDMARLLCRLAEVAQGMAYLHSKQIMHGDLKAANVLLVNSVHGSFGQIAKLTDFGLSGVLREGRTHHSTQHLGTISHCAPETLQHGHTSPAADVFAFGIMMWELFTCTTAYKDVHLGTLIQRVVLGGERPPIHPDTPEDYALLMEACWSSNPADRPTFDQVLQCLTIMLQSLDTATTGANAVLSTPQQVVASPTQAAAAPAAAGQPLQAAAMGAAAAALPPTAEAAAAAGGGPASALAVAGPLVAASSSLGSFDMCRTASNTSSLIGSSPSNSSLIASSRAGLGVQRRASMEPGLGPVAEVSAAAAAVPDGRQGLQLQQQAAGPQLQQQQQLGHIAGPLVAAAGTAAAGAAAAAEKAACGAGGAGAVETLNSTGSAGTSCSFGSSKLGSLQGAQSRHIQDLW